MFEVEAGQSLKRKTLKLKHPNPLFEKWLREWKEEAAARNSDTQFAFAKALISLKKYPLPLKSGKECLVLENFGTRICLLLDRKLAEYNKSHNGEPEPEGPSDDNIPTLEDKQRKTKKRRKSPDKFNSPGSKKNKPYIPTLRSAPYAVLVALYEHYKGTGLAEEMTKEDLQKAAQPLCDTSMFKPLPGSYYSGWSCVGQLVSKGLVQRRGSPHRYNLTEEGIKLAEKLPVIDLELSILNSLPNSPGKNVLVQPPNNNDITEKKKTPVKKSRFKKKETKINNCAGTSQEASQPEDLVSEECSSTQESKNSESCQSEEEIFCQGTFQIILLVDTQEIHKGDELVKALEAEGVILEVRNLKVGDFVWISRNTLGQELVMPYIIERKRLDDLASSIKDGRFHEQKFRLKQCGVPNCMYLVESHGQRQYSLPMSTLLQASTNTQFIDRFSVKFTANSHETVIFLASFSKVITKRFSNKTLLGCKKNNLPEFSILDDCISLMSFKEFNKLSSKIRKYNVKEMFIKQLVQLRGLSVEKALAIVERYPCPRSLMMAYRDGNNERLLADIPVGNLSRKIGPVISKALFELYNRPALS